jgi:hypothetical protein
MTEAKRARIRAEAPRPGGLLQVAHAAPGARIAGVGVVPWESAASAVDFADCLGDP